MARNMPSDTGVKRGKHRRNICLCKVLVRLADDLAIGHVNPSSPSATFYRSMNGPSVTPHAIASASFEYRMCIVNGPHHLARIGLHWSPPPCSRSSTVNECPGSHRPPGSWVRQLDGQRYSLIGSALATGAEVLSRRTAPLPFESRTERAL